MSHATRSFVSLFGGPQLFDPEQVRIDLAPRAAVLIGLVAISGDKGLPVETTMQYLWNSGTDRVLYKRLDQLIRSYQTRHSISPPLVIRRGTLVLNDAMYRSEYSDWTSSLAEGDILAAAGLWDRGLLPLHRPQLTTAGESYLLAQERHLSDRLERDGSRLLDEISRRADWRNVARISGSLHSVFPTRIRYARTLVVSLMALGRRYEADFHLDRLTESGLLTGSDADRLFRLVWRGPKEGRKGRRPNQAPTPDSAILVNPRNTDNPPPLLLGRQSELALLQRLLNRPASHGRVHGVIHGRLGSGKTALLNSIRAYAESIGYSTLSISCRGGDTGAPEPRLRGGHDPDADLDPRRSDTDAERELRHYLLSNRPATSGDIERIVDLTRSLFGDAPVLICVDDIDFVPFAMERLIGVLSHHVPRSSSVRTISTVTGPPSELAQSLDESMQQVTISDLCQADRLSLLRRFFPSDIPADSLAELQSANLGAPAFIVGLGQFLRDQGSPQEGTAASPGALPPSFIRYLRQHMKSFSVVTQQVLNLLSCAEHKVAVSDIQRIVNCDRQAALTALAELQRCNICFDHHGHFWIPWPRLRAHLVSRIPEPERVDLFLRLSNLISSSFTHSSAKPPPMLSLANAQYRLYLEDIEQCTAIATTHDLPDDSIDELKRQLQLLKAVQERAAESDPRIHARIAEVLLQLGQGSRARYWFERAAREFRLRGQSKQERRHRLLSLRASRVDPSADLGQIHSQAKALFADSLRKDWRDIYMGCLDLRLRLYDHSFDIAGIKTLLEEILLIQDGMEHASPCSQDFTMLDGLRIMCYVYVDPISAWNHIQTTLTPLLAGQPQAIDAETKGICQAGIMLLGKHDTIEGSTLLDLLGAEHPDSNSEPGHPFARMNHVVILLNSWEYDDAIVALHNLLSEKGGPGLCARTGLIHTNLSVGYARSRQWPEALAHVKQASDRLGCRPPGAARSGLSAVAGLEALERGAFAEAGKSLDFLNAIPAECPYDRVLPTKLRAQWAWLRGERDQALRTLEEASQGSDVVKTDEIYFRYTMARLLARMNRKTEAKNLWRICAEASTQHRLPRARELALAQINSH